MSNTKKITKTSTHIICPNCKEPSGTIDHFEGSKNTPFKTVWYCDHCGHKYSFIVDSELNVTELKLTGEFSKEFFVLLRNNNIGLVVKATHYTHEEDRHRYFYNSHTCPTNYLKQVVEIIDLDSGNRDPHGIFEYVATVPYTEEAPNFNSIFLLKTFQKEQFET